ncbi:MAG: SH3 domain-containing protein [Bacteroidota bacterium]
MKNRFHTLPNPCVALFFLLFLATSMLLNAQNTYIIKTNSAAVRSGAGKNYAVIGNLKKGDTVQVINYTSVSWAQIKFQNKTGYVNKNYLIESTQDVIPEVKQPSTEETLLKIVTSVWFFIGVVVFILLMLLRGAHKKKCPQCGRWNTMRNFKKEMPSGKPGADGVHISRIKPGAYAANTYKQAATKNYQVHRRCKSCQHEDYIEKIAKTAR